MADQGAKVLVNDCLYTGKTQPAKDRSHKHVEIFYGVRFATCKRFTPAVLADPTSSATLDASRPGPSVPYPFGPQKSSEDQLSLNIFRPAQTNHESGLPVVVFIHGGGFNFGNPLDNNLASLISWAPKDFIAVGISYRLGALGFLAGGPEAQELNLGLRDQRVAFEWLRKWVGAFGGNSDDITMMGNSAGAHSVGHHILNPEALSFRKAILSSGSATARSVLSPSHPRSVEQLQSMKKYGRNTSMKTLDLDNLLTNSVMIWGAHNQSLTWPFQPVIDGPGGAIPDSPLVLWEDFLKGEKAAGMAIITGFCSHEGADFVPEKMNSNSDFRSFFAKLIPAFADADLDALEKHYPDPATEDSSPYKHTGKEGKQWKRAHEAYAHYAYICPVIHTAHMLSKAGARVYLYEYAVPSAPKGLVGHSSQSMAVEHNVEGIGHNAPGIMTVAKEMNGRWAKFIAAPDGDLGDAWPLFTSPLDGLDGEGKMLVFGEGNDEGTGGKNAGTAIKERILTSKEKAQCNFWWQRMELSQGMGAKREKNP